MRKLSIGLALLALTSADEVRADFTAKDAALATITFKNPNVCTGTPCVPVAQLYDGTNVVSLTTAGANGVSNTLTGVPVYSRMQIFNGTTWDRWTGAITAPAGSAVDLLTMRGTAAAGTAATNSLLVGGIFNSTPITLTNAQQSSLQLDANGYLKVNTAAGAAAGGTSSSFGSAFPASGTAIGYTDGANMTAGRVGAVTNVAAATGFVNSLAVGQYNAAPLTVTDTRYQSLQLDVNGYLKTNVTNTNPNGRAAAASAAPVVPVAAASTAGAIQPNNTTAVVVKASAGTLFGVQLGGIGSAPAYVKFYNATSATCGSGTPVKRLIIPAASTAANGAGSNVSFGPGLAFSTGITYCVTTGIGDADATAAAASTFLINVDYE